MQYSTKRQKNMALYNLFRILISLLLFITTLFHIATPESTTTTKSTNPYKLFIINQCNSTTYPSVCNKSLSPYASKIQTNSLILTKISIYLALKSARSSSTYLKKLSNSKDLTHDETLVLADCKENVEDTVELIEESAFGLVHLNGTTTSKDRFQWDNIKTWMSAALTDESTCTDEFEEMEVRPSLQKKIMTSVGNLASLTSNALAFVNRLSY